MEKEKKTKELVLSKDMELPKARVIKIDTSVSLLFTSMPPGNPNLPGFNPPDWGKPRW